MNFLDSELIFIPLGGSGEIGMNVNLYHYQSDWLINNLGIESVKASLTGRNLIIWTDFEGNDPDTSLQGVSVARGIDYFNNPSTKSYVFTLELNF